MVKVDNQKKKDSFCPYDVCLRFPKPRNLGGKRYLKNKIASRENYILKNAEVLKITKFKIDYAEVLSYKTWKVDLKTEVWPRHA